MPRQQAQRETIGAREHASELGLRFAGFGSEIAPGTMGNRIPEGYYTDFNCHHLDDVLRPCVLLVTHGRAIPAVYDSMAESIMIDRSQAPIPSEGDEDMAERWTGAVISAARMADSMAERWAEEARDFDRAHYLQECLIPQEWDAISTSRSDAARLQRKGEASYAELARDAVRYSIQTIRDAAEELAYLPAIDR